MLVRDNSSLEKNKKILETTGRLWNYRSATEKKKITNFLLILKDENAF